MSATALPRGPVRDAHVRRLAWPVLVSMLSMSAMNVADTLFTGWLGTVELAAVGLSTTLSFFVLTFGRGLLRGAKILTSQRTGAEDHQAATALAAQAGWLGLGFGVAAIPLVFAGPTLFAFLGASEAVAPHAEAYFAVRVIFAPVALVAWGLEGWFQGRGDTRTPMVANLVANGLNIALDPLLIFGLGPVPALGVAGAAWATVVAQGALLAILLFRAWRALVAHPRWNPALVLDSLRLGLPVAVQWTLDFSGFLVFLGLLARAGDAHLAAHVLVFRIVMVSILPGFAIGDAAGVLVGQAVGARRPAAARQAWWSGLRQAVVFMGVLGVGFLVLPDLVLWPFAPEPEVAALSRTLLALAALWQVFDALVIVNYNALAGAGDTRFTLVLFVGGSWLVQVPTTLVLVLLLEQGAVGAWWALTLEMAVVSLSSLARVRSRGWLERKMGGEPVPDGLVAAT
jgi:multidrug resistance protein, MATE family